MSICVAGNFRQQLMLIALVWRVSLIMRSNNKCAAENDAGGGDGKVIMMIMFLVVVIRTSKFDTARGFAGSPVAVAGVLCALRSVGRGDCS